MNEQKKPLILISNDDGYQAKGINCLIDMLQPIADLPIYVNVRNERRFFRATPIRDSQTAGDRDRAILSTVSLRQQKALHLYHLIREYNLLTWWD